jgi:hypothetical protein
MVGPNQVEHHLMIHFKTKTLLNLRRQGTQHKNIQHNVTQNNDIQHNNIQHNDTQNNDHQHISIQYIHK